MTRLTVVFSRPEGLPFCVQKRGTYSHAVGFATYSAFKDVLDFQSVADLVGWLVVVLVAHDGVTGDYSEVDRIALPKLRNHFLRKAVTEVVLGRITSKVVKRQHGEHDPSARLRGPGVPRPTNKGGQGSAKN